MDMATQVQLVFRGEVLEGCRAGDVMRALGERLKLDAAAQARLFTASRTVVKRSVDMTEAQRYVTLFHQLGARLHIEPLPAARVADAAGGSASLAQALSPSEAFRAAASASMAPQRAAAAATPARVPSRPAATPLPSLPTLPDPDPFPPPMFAPVPPPRPAPAPPTAPPPVPAALPATAGSTTAAAAAAAATATAAAAASAAAAVPGDEEIVCPNCNERQSKRVLCRACSTNMPMGIAAKAEALQKALDARQAERDAKRGVRPAYAQANDTSPPMWGFGIQGRMGRLPYWTCNTLLLIPVYLALLPVIKNPSGTNITVLMIVGLVWLAASVRATVLRLHDLNASGWWCVIMTVPTIGQAASLALSFVPGTIGENDHGDPPRLGRWLHLGLSALALALIIGVSIPGVISAWVMNAERAEEARQRGEDPDDDRGLIPLPGVAAPSATLPPGEASQVFHGPYAAAPAFKAFAASPAGTWGFAAGAPSLKDAMAAAMTHCESHRSPDKPPCEIIDSSAR